MINIKTRVIIRVGVRVIDYLMMLVSAVENIWLQMSKDYELWIQKGEEKMEKN